MLIALSYNKTLYFKDRKELLRSDVNILCFSFHNDSTITVKEISYASLAKKNSSIQNEPNLNPYYQHKIRVHHKATKVSTFWDE